MTEGDFGVNTMTTAEERSQQSLLSAMNKFVQAVNLMDETVMIPSRLRDMSVPEKVNETTAVVPAHMNMNADLHSFYQMLNAIKTELVRGEQETREPGDVNRQDEDEHAKQTAAVFRHHLSGLFNVLKQLTDTANSLTSRYTEELGDIYTSSTKVSAFACL